MGGLIRLLEFMYLGAPLHSILRAGRTSTLEYIEHLPGVLEHMPQSNHNMQELTKVPKGNRPPYLVLKNARIHLKTGIVALNSGHFFTNRLEFQDFSSGYHYSHLRELQHSKPLILPGKFIPLALQTYYFHIQSKALICFEFVYFYLAISIKCMDKFWCRTVRTYVNLES